MVEIDPSYARPHRAPGIFGITFEQGYNDLDINEEMLQNVVTENKELSQQAKERYAPLPHHPEIHPVQLRLLCQERHDHRRGRLTSRAIHCTRLAGNKADIWWLRQHPQRSWASSLWTRSAAPRPGQRH